MSDAIPDLSLVARQQTKVLSEIGTMRNDMAVMMAILQRLDGTISDWSTRSVQSIPSTAAS